MRKVVGAIMAFNAVGSVYLYMVSPNADLRFRVGVDALLTGAAAYYLL